VERRLSVHSETFRSTAIELWAKVGDGLTG
jgi:hypothetical protein